MTLLMNFITHNQSYEKINRGLLEIRENKG